MQFIAIIEATGGSDEDIRANMESFRQIFNASGEQINNTSLRIVDIEEEFIPRSGGIKPLEHFC